MSEEEWKSIPGFDQYEASNLGNVRNTKTKRVMEKFQAKNGYVRLTLRKNGKYVSVDIHRLVAQTFLPNPDNKKTVNHINHIRNDNRLENLEWATHTEQSLHALQQPYRDQYSNTSIKPSVSGTEEWKNMDVDGYSISNTGIVRNDRKKTYRTLIKDGRGYTSVTLKGTVIAIHRAVAKAFLSGFTDTCVVNHKDGNPSNNHVSNLECVSQSMNILHAYATESIKKRKLTSCIQVDYQGNVIGSYTSLAEAEATTGHNRGAIHDAINKGVTCGKCRWYKSYEDYEKDKHNIYASILKVFQYGMDGQLIAVYDDFVEAENATGISKNNINRAVNRDKEALLSAKGFIWTTTRVPKTEALERLRNAITQ